jgi:hypothetical protein
MDRRRKGKERSMSDNPMFLYAGEYESVDDAKADLETLKEMHREHIMGTYDVRPLLPRTKKARSRS